MNAAPRLNWPRVIVAVVIGEVVPLLVLIGVVHFLRPDDPTEVDAFARHMGAYVGPIGGFVTVLVVSWWAGRGSSAPVPQGTMIGVILAIIDGSIVIAIAEPFGWLWFVSNGGKIAAGAFGGWLARRARR
jgi:hypothetical protein